MLIGYTKCLALLAGCVWPHGGGARARGCSSPPPRPRAHLLRLRARCVLSRLVAGSGFVEGFSPSESFFASGFLEGLKLAPVF